MYINFKLAHERGFKTSQIIALQMIKQNKFEDLSYEIEEYIDIDLQWFEDNKFVEYIKAKNKKQNKFELIRLSKKGAEVLDSMETPFTTNSDLVMSDYLCQMYLSSDDEGRTIGNVKLVRIYCAQFRQLMGLSLHEMYWLCHLFIQNQKYTKVLENIFFVKKDNPYGKFKDNIESSKLYQFYNDNKQDVENYWKQMIKEEV